MDDVEFCWTSLHFPYIWYMRMKVENLHYVTLDKTPSAIDSFRTIRNYAELQGGRRGISKKWFAWLPEPCSLLRHYLSVFWIVLWAVFWSRQLQTLMASLCSTLQVACVVRAFQHLHQRHIIYRDMQLGSLQGDSFGKQSTRLFWTSVNQPFPQEARESSTGLKGILQGTATSVRQEV